MWNSYDVNKDFCVTQIYSLFESHFDSSYSFSGETHNFWECLYVKKGKISVSGNERVFSLKDGNLIFHKPLELHKFNVESQSGAEVFIFSFSLDGNIAPHLKYNVFSLNKEQKKIIEEFTSYIKKENPSYLSASKKEVMYLQEGLKKSKYLPIVALFIEILIMSLSENKKTTLTDSSPAAATFTKAVNYMNNNISSHPSIESIASYCNISTTGLKRIFTKYAGLGIHKYFLKMKINAAIELLKDGHTISDTAFSLGFSNQGYFSYVFKRETGKQPSYYKR